MNFDFRSKDIDRLVEYLDQIISSAVAGDADPDALIRIAEAVKALAVSAKSGIVSGSAFLQELVKLSADSPARASHTSAPSCNSAIQPTLLNVGKGITTSHSPANNPAPQADDTLRNESGDVIILGKCLGQGGEGSVYKLPSLPGKVAKVYHKLHLDARHARDIEEKIRFLITKKEAAYLDGILIAAMPQEILYHGDGTFAGYIMPQFSTSTKLFDVQREGLRRKLFPDLDYRGLIVIAYNLAEAVNHLHNHGIVVGDLNQNNILVHPDGTIGMIDCDSYDVTDPATGKHFPCCVGLQELLAPELQSAGSLRTASFTKESDSFSLAIHIFRLLMDNADPFGGCWGPDSPQRSVTFEDMSLPITRGECAYFREVPGKQISPCSPPAEALPTAIQTLFRRTFDYTVDTAVVSAPLRPSAAEWMKALEGFYQMRLIQCRQDPFHLHLPSLPKCPFCRV